MNRRVRKAGVAQVEVETFPEPTPAEPPKDWVKGQLLNVRASADGYRVTLLSEEYDPQRPDRCLFFPNTHECQKFVSSWYSRQSADPRA